MNLTSEINQLKIQDLTLFKKLSVIENYKEIMPDNVSKFEIIDSNSFIFSIKGMPSIKLKIGEKVANVDLSKILSKLENLVIVRADSDWRECSCENTDLHDKEGFHEYFHFNQPIIFRG